MKIRTTEQLVDAIDEDLAWRRKELTTLRFVIDRFRMKPRVLNTSLRAGITLLYAHWEGFLKKSSELYVEFVGRQSLPNSQLADNFLAISARTPLHNMLSSPRTTQSMAVVHFFRRKMTDNAVLPSSDSIKTKSNLTSEVLKDIASTVGVKFSLFETKATLIDEKLVHKRNHVAHGQFLDFDASSFEELLDEVTAMMETWRNEIQNACITKRYRFT
jgi:hypothetical protein